ncbi:MAG: hypothetical protein U0894_10015 [Pirellulales bacterium]
MTDQPLAIEPSVSVWSIYKLYLLSSVVFVLAVYWPFIRNPWVLTKQAIPENYLVDTLSQLDGRFYAQVLQAGYASTDKKSTLAAFFPGYPCVASILFECGLPANWSLLAVNWLALLGSFLLARHYLTHRFPHSPQVVYCTIAALAFYPMGFHLRFMYSESLFLCSLLLLFVLMQERVSPILVALLGGAITGIRPPGVATIPVVLLYAWSFEEAWKPRLKNVLLSFLFCGWGLAAYMWHLQQACDNPLAFMDAQENWVQQSHTFSEKLWSLATLAPIYRALEGSTSGFKDLTFRWLLFNQVADALCWLLFASLLIYGGWKKWLNRQELLLSALLFGFCTWFQADRNNMVCQGRFVSVIFPAYITAGHQLAATRWQVRLVLWVVASLLYINYASNFASGFAW